MKYVLKFLVIPIVALVVAFSLPRDDDAPALFSLTSKLGPHDLSLEVAEMKSLHGLAEGYDGLEPYDLMDTHAVVLKGRPVMLQQGELMIDGRSYGALRERSRIVIDAKGNVRINKMPVFGDLIEEAPLIVPENGRVEVDLGAYPLRTDAIEGVYRVATDKRGNRALWSPGLNVRIITGRVYINGDDYGVIEPGQRIDITSNTEDWWDVAVGSEPRRPRAGG